MCTLCRLYLQEGKELIWGLQDRRPVAPTNTALDTTFPSTRSYGPLLPPSPIILDLFNPDDDLFRGRRGVRFRPGPGRLGARDVEGRKGDSGQDAELDRREAGGGQGEEMRGESGRDALPMVISMMRSCLHVERSMREQTCERPRLTFYVFLYTSSRDEGILHIGTLLVWLPTRLRRYGAPSQLLCLRFPIDSTLSHCRGRWGYRVWCPNILRRWVVPVHPSELGDEPDVHTYRERPRQQDPGKNSTHHLTLTHSPTATPTRAQTCPLPPVSHASPSKVRSRRVKEMSMALRSGGGGTEG